MELLYLNFIEHTKFVNNYNSQAQISSLCLCPNDITVSSTEHGGQLDYKECNMPMWFQLLVLVCALSLVWCFEVQAASAQKGTLIKLKPCIVITDNTGNCVSSHPCTCYP